MKKILIACVSLAVVSMGLASCSDWLEADAYDFERRQQSDEYYANLRAWKDTWKEREISFGWFGGWTANDTHMRSSLAGIPDSLDLVGMWGTWLPSQMTEKMKNDLKYVQQVKNTKVIPTVISGWVGAGISGNISHTDYQKRYELWGWEPEWNTAQTWNSDDPEIRARQELSIRRYARALVDSIKLGGYDGFDIDHEPTVGGAGSKQELANYDNFHILVEELAVYLGPKSNSGLMLVVDGEVEKMHGKTMPYFDYLIKQAYNYTNEASLNSHITSTINTGKEFMTPQQIADIYIVTVDYEANRSNGGGTFTGADSRVEGFAAWTPVYNGEELNRKGGAGGYHIEYEYAVAGKSGFYPTMRSAIQIMNPVGGVQPEEETEGSEG